MSKYFKQKPAIKALFVEEGLEPDTIARRYKNRPTPQTVRNWSNQIDEHGKTWRDYRREYQEEMYLLSSNTKTIAAKILMRIHKLLDSEDFSTKTADALAKLQKNMEAIVDPKYHVGMLFTFLEDFIAFMREHYPEMATEEFASLARDYKNHIRDRGGFGLPENP